jgi:histidine triad (HIT) family protein
MDSCIFCKILNKEIPATMAYENNSVIVIKDINPQAPLHYLVIPREHFAGIHEVPPGKKEFFNDLMNTTKTFIEKENLSGKGYRLVINYGEIAGQAVPHIHIHLLSGRPMKWPPG